MFLGKQNPELEKFADILIKSTVGLFAERGEIEFSKKEKTKRKIIEYNGRMRADGMERFKNEPTYVSVVNYFANATDMARQKALGAVVVYVQQEYLVPLMKLLKYPPIDDESESALLDSCGTLANIIAGRYKSDIVSAGYIELEMSHFSNYRNTSFDGVAFCFNEFSLYEISFEIEHRKRIVLDMSMGVVPRR